MSRLREQEEDTKIRKVIKDTEFFQISRFQTFQSEINSSSRFAIKPENINEVSIKCYGYGYFEDNESKMQTELKRNLISYLKEVLGKCPNVKTLRLDFHGFSIADNSLLRIIQLFEHFSMKKSQKESISLHTRFLRDCSDRNVIDMLNLTDNLVKAQPTFEYISLMMSGWQFSQGPLRYRQLEKIFLNFTENLTTNPDSHPKRLKLDISSWYMHNLQAYNLLKETLDYENLAKKIEAAASDSGQGQVSNDFKQWVREYLENLDKKYAIDNPLPGKVRYIHGDKQYQRRKLEYINKLLSRGTNAQDLKKVYNQSWGMPEVHSVELKKIKQEIDQELEAQKKRIQEEERISDKTTDLEKDISQKLKFPFDYLMAERVKAFQVMIITFAESMQNHLEALDEFQLDMRNWNNLFQMKDLKKLLDKEFAQMGAMKLIGNAFSKVMSAALGQMNQEDHSIKMTFLM